MESKMCSPSLCKDTLDYTWIRVTVHHFKVQWPYNISRFVIFKAQIVDIEMLDHLFTARQ